MKKNEDGMGTNMEDLRSIIGEVHKPIGLDDYGGGYVWRTQQSGLCGWKILQPRLWKYAINFQIGCRK